MKVQKVKSGIPKNARIHVQNEKKARMTMRGDPNMGLLVALGPVAFILSLFMVGGVMLAVGEDNLGDSGFLWFIFFMVLNAFIFHRIFRSKLRLSVTPKIISVNGKNYDRTLWGGFKLGIETTTRTERAEHSRIAIMFEYGGVEEKAKLHLNSTVALNNVHWLNRFVDSVPQQD